jgi:hypothetical protein
MSRRLFVIAVAFIGLITPAPLRASCGSSSCPLDTNALNQPLKGHFALDLSLQSIDQDQPRIGTRSAHVGEIPGPHHDEVRTVNHIATAVLSYAPADRLHLSLSVPFISREHDHLASSHAHGRGPVPQHNTIPESWDIRGAGDVVLQARVAVADFNPLTHSRLWVIGGIKLPTGADDLRNDEGEVAELPVQPGSGTTDGIAGLSYQSGFLKNARFSGPMGNVALVPWFVSATYQFRTGASHGYRLGNELQVNGGTVYPLTRRLDVLMQLNARVREKDRIEDEPAEEAFTGGTFVYASPGLRFSLRHASLYALVQVPLYQDVNAIQLTSKRNYVTGVQIQF